MPTKGRQRAQAKYNSKPEQVKRRTSRNAARRKMLASGRVRKGQDVHHKNGNPMDNNSSNLKASTPSKNRSVRRNRRAQKR